MNIDWTYHLYSLVPNFLRRPKRMAWLQVMLTGLRSIHAAFLVWRMDVNRRASFTGQTMVLERMLNLHYFQDLNGDPLDIWASPPDPTAGGHIWIDQTSNLNSNPAIWYESEGQSATRRFYFESENGPSPAPIFFANEGNPSYSFRVMVPLTLYDQMIVTELREPELRALIDRYNEAGHYYTIAPY